MSDDQAVPLPPGWQEGPGWVSYPDPSRCEMCGERLGSRRGPRCAGCEETYEADGGDTMHDVTDDQAVPLPDDAIDAALPLGERFALQLAMPEEIDHEEVRAFTVAMLAAAADVLRAQGAATERAKLNHVAVVFALYCDYRENTDEIGSRAKWADTLAREIADLLDGTP